MRKNTKKIIMALIKIIIALALIFIVIPVVAITLWVFWDISIYFITAIVIVIGLLLMVTLLIKLL